MAPQVQSEPQVQQVQQDLLAQLGHKVFKVMLALLDLLEQQGQLVQQDQLAQLDQQDQLVQQAQLELLEPQEL